MAVVAERLPVIISPASGIRRPSYNGAPAMQSLARFQLPKAMTRALFQPAALPSSAFNPLVALTSFITERSNVRGLAAHTAQNALLE